MLQEAEPDGAVQAQQFLLRSMRSTDAAPRLGSHGAYVNEQLAPKGGCPNSAFVVLDDVKEWRTSSVFNPAAAEDEVAWREAMQGRAPEEAVAHTAAIGPLALPVNCAEPSPDGNWIAVLTDRMTVMLLPEALDYRTCAAASLEIDLRAKKCGPGCLPVLLCLRCVYPFALQHVQRCKYNVTICCTMGCAFVVCCLCDVLPFCDIAAC